MKKEAEEFAEKDKQEKENIETLNNAESLAYTAEKTINDAGEKIDSATKDNIKAIVKDLRDAISQKDIPKVKEITEKLTKEIQEVGAKMYASASANNQNNTGNAGTSGENQSDSSNDKTSGENSDTINADYKENK